MPAGRSGAASRGAKVKTGSGGSGRGGAGRPSRVRRLAGPGFKPAARAGGGPAGRSGAAPRGAGVQTGGEGGRGPGAAFTGPARTHQGSLIPICPVRGEGRAQVGAPCAPREHPDYIYQRVASPQTPTTPSPITQSGQGGSSPQGKSDIPPPRHPSPGSGPLPPGLPGRSNPPTPARSRRFGPPGACSGSGCAPGNHRGALAVRRAPYPAITLRIHPGQEGVSVSAAAGHAARATRARPPRHLPPPLPPRPALPRPTDRPVPLPAFAARLNPRPVGPAPGWPPPPRPYRCRRRWLEPSLREMPRSGDRLRPAPAPTAVVAACLELRSVGCRAGPTGRSPFRRRCPS